MGPPPGRVKNPCRICELNVADKSGVQCKGACARWAHYKCLGFSPQMILDARDGKMEIVCPCPHCNLKKLDVEIYQRYTPCRNDGNCEALGQPPPRMAKISMCDDQQWIDKCDRETCYPPCAAIKKSSPPQTEIPSGTNSPIRVQQSNQKAYLPLQQLNNETDTRPPPPKPQRVKKDIYTTMSLNLFAPATTTQRLDPIKVEKQTSWSKTCGGGAPCVRREPCQGHGPCGPNKECIKSAANQKKPEKVSNKQKDYKYTLEDTRAAIDSNKTASNTSLGRSVNQPKDLNKTASKTSFGRSVNQGLVCDSPKCRDAACSPIGRCYTKENEADLKRRLERATSPPCLRNRKNPMIAKQPERPQLTIDTKSSPANINLGEQNAPCRNCKCGLGTKLDQFKCVSTLCPTRYPRPEPPKLVFGTTCSEDKSKSCTCMNMSAEQVTTKAHETSRSSSDSKIAMTAQSTLLYAIDRLCATVGQLSGQIQSLLTRRTN